MPPPKGYPYYSRDEAQTRLTEEKIAEAEAYGRSRLRPDRSDPSYLVLRKRREIFEAWLEELPGQDLRVLDVGGRIQPYRPLVRRRAARYVGLDPQLRGLVDVVGNAEDLPFPAGAFDLVLCTQVLQYTGEPARAADELCRVLGVGGTLLLSVPAFFPQYHDHRWRFMPEWIEILLSRFGEVEILPEGRSVLGFCRTLNLALDIALARGLPGRLARRLLIPAVNVVGETLDPFSRENEQFTANYSVRAVK